jgi:hypothetical protein
MRRAVLPFAVLAAGLLTACAGADTGTGGSAVKPDTAACEKAAVEAVKKSLAGDKTATDAPVPAPCEGLSKAAREKIAKDAAAKAVGDAFGGDEKASADTPDAKADVKITGCAKDEFGYPKAQLEVRNSTGETQSMNVQVVFNGPDGTRLADGGALVNSLEAGGKSEEEAMGLKQVSGKFVCKIGSVDRWKS